MLTPGTGALCSRESNCYKRRLREGAIMRQTMKTLYTLLGGFAFLSASVLGQASTPAAPSAAPVKEIVLTGTTANVKDSGTPVTIRLFRWSTDEERAALLAAFTAPAP